MIINLGQLTVKNEFFTSEKTPKKINKAINSMKIALTNFNINTHILVPSKYSFPVSIAFSMNPNTFFVTTIAPNGKANKKEPLMENLTLITNIAQICRLQSRHTLPPSNSSVQVKGIDKLPEIDIGVRFPPLHFFLHGEQLAFLTELGLIMGNFGMVVANAVAEVTSDAEKAAAGKEVIKKDETRNRAASNASKLDNALSLATV